MDDLISRQAAIDVVKESHECGWYLMETISHIEELPTVDAVEVVRCKDCSHFMSEGCLVVRSNKFAFPNGFCNWGERRTDE